MGWGIQHDRSQERNSDNEMTQNELPGWVFVLPKLLSSGALNRFSYSGV
jgi:hypothetical protein